MVNCIEKSHQNREADKLGKYTSGRIRELLVKDGGLNLSLYDFAFIMISLSHINLGIRSSFSWFDTLTNQLLID